MPLRADFRLAPEDYNHLHRTIVLANPNAPTGLALSRDDVEGIVRANPDAVVVVATIRALKMHGGAPKGSLGNEDIGALERGIGNLLRHISNIKEVYRLPLTVALNRFPTDTERETALVAEKCAALGVRAVVSDVWANGGAGGEELAREVVRLCEEEQGDFRFAYDASATIEEKLSAVVTKVYRGDGVDLTPQAQRDIARLTRLGFGGLPVCVAKTQYSFSDDPSRLCAPSGFRVTVRSVKVSAGAGFVVALTGDILTMPGLPASPAAERIDVTPDGRITGLF